MYSHDRIFWQLFITIFFYLFYCMQKLNVMSGLGRVLSPPRPPTSSFESVSTTRRKVNRQKMPASKEAKTNHVDRRDVANACSSSKDANSEVCVKIT